MADKKSVAHWSCMVCACPVNYTDITTCSKCQAVVYCSDTCLQQESQNTCSQYAHSLWCERMVCYMLHTSATVTLPFTYAPETTSVHFTSRRYKAFLKDRGLYDVGLWRREPPLNNQLRSTKYGELSSGSLAGDIQDNPYNLPEGQCLSLKPREAPVIADWESYYSLRRLPLHSPIAIVLTHALTVYYIILVHFSQSIEKIPDVLTVHLLGVEREVELLPTFKELAHLLPLVRVRLIMYGDNISPVTNDKFWTYENITIHVVKALYHQRTSECPPHLAVGLNAGLVAYQGWCDSLHKLKTQGTPAYFTDYSEYSAAMSETPVSSLHVGSISQITLNPFRSPARLFSREHHIPTFTNGFLFRLAYS